MYVTNHNFNNKNILLYELVTDYLCQCSTSVLFDQIILSKRSIRQVISYILKFTVAKFVYQTYSPILLWIFYVGWCFLCVLSWASWLSKEGWGFSSQVWERKAVYNSWVLSAEKWRGSLEWSWSLVTNDIFACYLLNDRRQNTYSVCIQ